MSDQTPSAGAAVQITRVARGLLADGNVGDAPLRRSATVLEALPVLVLGGGLHSWLVPVTVGDRLAAIFQFQPDGTLRRFSMFHRRLDDFADCPLAADWLDRNRIRTRAEALRGKGEMAGEPFLSYDRTPDRLVWAVPLTQAGGKVRHIFVAGETVYVPPPGGTFG